MSTIQIYLKRKFNVNKHFYFRGKSSNFFFLQHADSTPLQNNNFSNSVHYKFSNSITMTSQDTSVVELPIASTRLRSLILKKHISTLYTQLTQEKKADPILTRMILFNVFQIFQINRIYFEQYLKLHNHPDTFIQKSDATTQTDNTTIRPKHFPRNLSNRMRTPLEKQALVQYWPSDDNVSTDDELQKDPSEVLMNENSRYKTYTYVSF